MNFAMHHPMYDVNVQFLFLWKFYKNWEFLGATIFLTSLRFVIKEKYLRSRNAPAACENIKSRKLRNFVMNFAINYLTHDVNVQFLVFWKFNQNWEFRGRATIFF